MLLYLCKKYQTKKYSINNHPVINGLGVINCTTSGTTISIHRIFDLITVESTNIRCITFRVYLYVVKTMIIQSCLSVRLAAAWLRD